MQKWSEIPKLCKHHSLDFEQLVLYIPHRNEELSLSDNDMCETGML
jgi:hypothetical protein